MNSLAEFSLQDFLPYSLKQDQETLYLAQAISEEFQKIINDVNLLDPKSEIPDHLLDIVAWQEHVDFYDNSLPIETKRELVNKSPYFHQRKATPAAVEDLINTIFGEGRLMEWFEYGGQPGYFKVLTSNMSVTQDDAEKFLKALNSIKRISAWLEKVEFIAFIREYANLILTHSSNINVTRSVLMNNGGIYSTGIFLDGSFRLDGSKTLNNPARPGPTATSSQKITVTREFQYDYNIGILLEFMMMIREYTNISLIPGIKIIVTRPVLMNNREDTSGPIATSSEQITVSRAFQSAYTTRVQGPKLDGQMILNSKWTLSGQTTDTPSTSVSVTCNGQAV